MVLCARSMRYLHFVSRICLTFVVMVYVHVCVCIVGNVRVRALPKGLPRCRYWVSNQRPLDLRPNTQIVAPTVAALYRVK